MPRLRSLVLAMAALPTVVYAAEPLAELPTIVVKAHPLNVSGNDMVSPVVVLHKNKLEQSSTQLGTVLADQLGIRQDNFGGGASRPIIRGQNAPRVQVMQSGIGVIDTSNLSPDHAVTVDPLLAERVEVIKGPATLLYGGGSIGGIVNVEDQLITTHRPTQSSSSTLGVRMGSNDAEKTAWGGATLKLSDALSVRLEGVYKDADAYKAVFDEHAHHDEHDANPVNGLHEVDGSFSKQHNAGLGLSWVSDQLQVGLSHRYRKDNYGIPGHSHLYEDCHLHDNQLHCDAHDSTEEEHTATDHGVAPEINLETQRTQWQAQWNQPIAGVKSVLIKGAYTDYQHDELDEGEIKTTFKTKGHEVRTELKHEPIAGFEGVLGLSLQQKQLSAMGSEAYLPDSERNNMALFVLQHRNVGRQTHIEWGARYEHQQIQADAMAENARLDVSHHGTSGSLSVLWDGWRQHTVGVEFNHAVRLPDVAELASGGVHLATNTYELGSANLASEQANTLEFSLKRIEGKLRYEANVYQNKIKHYIYAHTLDQQDAFRLVEYRNRDATFTGGEVQVSYSLQPNAEVTVFADHVQATFDDTGEYLPRIPADRVGLKYNQRIGRMDVGGQWTHVRAQSHIAAHETRIPDYNKVDFSLSYKGQVAANAMYRAFVQVDNVFNTSYYNAASFQATLPQQGRKLLAGVVFKF